MDSPDICAESGDFGRMVVCAGKAFCGFDGTVMECAAGVWRCDGVRTVCVDICFGVVGIVGFGIAWICGSWDFYAGAETVEGVGSDFTGVRVAPGLGGGIRDGDVVVRVYGDAGFGVGSGRLGALVFVGGDDWTLRVGASRWSDAACPCWGSDLAHVGGTESGLEDAYSIISGDWPGISPFFSALFGI